MTRAGSGRSGGSREPTEFVGGSTESKPKEQSSLLEVTRSEACIVITSGPRREAKFVLRGDDKRHCEGDRFRIGRTEIRFHDLPGDGAAGR